MVLVDIVHNQLPKGEDPYSSLLFENGASLKITLSFDGNFAELVDYTDDDNNAKAAIAASIFSFIYASFGGEVPVDAESDDGEAA